jgi:hypothetical protein
MARLLFGTALIINLNILSLIILIKFYMLNGILINQFSLLVVLIKVCVSGPTKRSFSYRVISV